MPTATYEKIEARTLGSATATVTFSTIPATYTDLVFVFNGGTTSSGPTMRFTVNGDSGANYSDTALDGDGSSAVSTRHSGANFMAITNNVGIAGTLGAQTTIMQLQNYSNASTYKTVLFRANNATSSGFPGVTAAVGLWRNTAALSGSTFTLYGIKAA